MYHTTVLTTVHNNLPPLVTNCAMLSAQLSSGPINYMFNRIVRQIHPASHKQNNSNLNEIVFKLQDIDAMFT